VDATDTTGGTVAAGSYTDTSYGGFLNVRPFLKDALIGFGYDYTTRDDLNKETDAASMATGYGHFSHKQMFGALQYYLGKQVMIKLVLAYASSHLVPTVNNGYTNTMWSGRLRLQYLF